MNASHLIKLAELATDVAAIDGGTLAGVRLGEMADGSGRSFALVELMTEDGADAEYRLSSPAPTDGPAWTRTMTEWTLEARHGERWLDLELELADDGRIGVAPELEAVAGDPAGVAALAAAVDESVVAPAPYDALGRRLDDESERAYEIASADVVLPLDRHDAEAIADALELLAGIDEGEHTDYGALVRLAGIVRAHMEVRS